MNVYTHAEGAPDHVGPHRASHVFVVGLYRSGNTLLRRLLNASPEVAVSGETNYLGKLLGGGLRHELRRVGDLASDEGCRRIVDHLWESPRGDFWRWLPRHVPRQDFLARLLASERDERALLDLLMTLYAGPRPVRGEKTPGHVYHVPTLLEWFPRARVVHTVRDPRAVYVSQTAKLRRQRRAGRIPARARGPASVQSVRVLASWLRVVALHRRYAAAWPDRYLLVRYEDLVREPERTMERVCALIGVELTAAMLAPGASNSSFVAPGEAVQGFDHAAVSRWREHLTPAMDRWFRLWCGRRLAELGYER